MPRWLVYGFVVAVGILVMDEVAFYWWRNLNPHQQWSLNTKTMSNGIPNKRTGTIGNIPNNGVF